MDDAFNVSAVITAYNGAEMLPAALECVLQQQCTGVLLVPLGTRRSETVANPILCRASGTIRQSH